MGVFKGLKTILDEELANQDEVDEFTKQIRRMREYEYWKKIAKSQIDRDIALEQEEGENNALEDYLDELDKLNGYKVEEEFTKEPNSVPLDTKTQKCECGLGENKTSDKHYTYCEYQD